ncbi:MAG: hypothetical protein JWS10_3504 [Cypionkella sp.]|uniref:hypothetical protein n=1 Tax=Cypionkella sp. TaxID=2811411 RepID=UPI00262F739B|nr:hypothetical protein [Cypionkella sp.]MDB5660889.1 hypothetical protein [Cypionkella sp.]
MNKKNAENAAVTSLWLARVANRDDAEKLGQLDSIEHILSIALKLKDDARYEALAYLTAIVEQKFSWLVSDFRRLAYAYRMPR